MSACTTLYFLLLPNTLMLDAAGPAEVFQYVNRHGEERFRLRYVGPESPVHNSIGMSISVEPLPDSIEPDSWLLIPGQTGDHIPLDTRAIDQACRWLQNHKFSKMVGICAGSLVLAKAGCLKDKSCTTHHQHLAELQQAEPKAKVLEDRLFVEDKQCFTSAGVTAGIDLALHLVQQECGVDIAAQVARAMVLFCRRGPNDPAWSPWLAFRNHLHQGVHRVQDAIQAQPTHSWPMEELASLAHVSPRHLGRLFKSHTGTTTREYIYQLRLALARQLLTSSDKPIETIAHHCGFEDPRQFRRIWSRTYSQSPSQFRHSSD